MPVEVASTGVVLLPPWGMLPLLLILPWLAWRERRDMRRLLPRVAAALYLGVLFSLTFFPLPLPPYDVLPGTPLEVNLQPFRSIGRAFAFGPMIGYQPVLLVLGNIAAFVPLGALWPLLRPSGHSWLACLALGAGLSAAIELGQLGLSAAMGFSYRQADIDDVILNTVGAVMGYGGYRLLRAGIDRRFRRRAGLASARR